MNSEIVRGSLFHRRITPRQYSFVYPTACFLLDLEEFARNDFGSRLVSKNRWNLFSFHERDFLRGTGSVLEKFSAIMAQHSTARAASVRVLTMPRVLGYVFNPANIYFAEDGAGTLIWALAEVSNTFGEKYLYPIEVDQRREFEKVFYVSPFLDTKGRYDIEIRYASEKLSVTIVLKDEGVEIFRAAIDGSRLPLTARNLAASSYLICASSLLAMARIHLHAVLLVWKAMAPVFQKSEHVSDGSWRYSTSLFYPLRRWLLRRGASIRRKTTSAQTISMTLEEK